MLDRSGVVLPTYFWEHDFLRHGREGLSYLRRLSYYRS